MSNKKNPLEYGCRGGWYKYEHNPVVGEEDGFTFDPTLIKMEDKFRLYVSWIIPGDDFTSIAFSESKDGLTGWSERTVVMKPRTDVGYEDEINRNTVLYEDGVFKMWYTSQFHGGYVPKDFADKYENSEVEGSWRSVISYAQSNDGIKWECMDDPIFVPEQPWEKNSVMGPSIMHDKEANLYRMWYSAGAWAEPDAIGYAESEDGINWKRPLDRPIMLPEKSNVFEQDRIAGTNVMKLDGWYYMFYAGFEELYLAHVCLARSRDGINNWERHPLNPLVGSGLPESFDYGCTYKSTTWYDEENDRWLLYYNGSNGPVERIGVAIHPGRDFWSIK